MADVAAAPGMYAIFGCEEDDDEWPFGDGLRLGGGGKAGGIWDAVSGWGLVGVDVDVGVGVEAAGRGGSGGGEAVSVGLVASVVCFGCCSSVVDSSLSAGDSGLASSVVSFTSVSSVSAIAADILALLARVGVLAPSSDSWVSVAAGFSGGGCTRSDSSYAGGWSKSDFSSCAFVSSSDAGETSGEGYNCCGSSSLTFGGSGGEAHRWRSGDILPELTVDALEMVSCFLVI